MTITLASHRSENEIDLVQNKNRIFYNSRVKKTFSEQQKWHLHDLCEYTKIASYDLDEINRSPIKIKKKLESKQYQASGNVKICATSYVSRKPEYFLWNAFFLIFLITCCTLNTFSIDAKLPQVNFVNVKRKSFNFYCIFFWFD